MASSVTVAPGKVGLTAMHSMVYGVPVVTHGDASDQMPEWEAIIPGKTGSLFQSGNVQSLSDAILKWTQSQFPESTTQKECHKIIDRFGILIFSVKQSKTPCLAWMRTTCERLADKTRIPTHSVMMLQ